MAPARSGGSSSSSPGPLSDTATAPAMAEVPSASVAAASSPSPPLRDREHGWLHQSYIVPGTYNDTILRNTTIIESLAGASDTMEMTEATYRYMEFCCNLEAKLASKSSRKLITQRCFYEHELKTSSTNCKNDCRLIMNHLMKNVRNFNSKKSTSQLWAPRELAELMLTCEAQNCLDGSCSSSLYCSVPGGTIGEEYYKNISCTLPQLKVQSPMLQVNESSWKELKLLTRTAQNLISNESITITNPGVLHNAITTHPPCTGASSEGDTAGAITGPLLLLLVLFSFGFFSKSKVPCTKGRRRGSAGSQDDSHGAAGDMDTQAEESV